MLVKIEHVLVDTFGANHIPITKIKQSLQVALAGPGVSTLGTLDGAAKYGFEMDSDRFLLGQLVFFNSLQHSSRPKAGVV